MYIVVEGEDPGYDIFVNGHALARNEDALEKLALRLGVRPLLEFFSADQNSMALLLEEGAGDPEWAKTLPPPQWFSPQDGLATVRTLLEHLKDAPGTLGSETEAVVSELSEYTRVLEKTVRHNLRWQLAVSWK
jgi:hypothetical protein